MAMVAISSLTNFVEAEISKKEEVFSKRICV